MRVELLDGHHAVLREPETVTNRERRVALRAMDTVDGENAKELAMVDSLISQLVESWDLEMPLPDQSADVFDRINPADYDALRDGAFRVYNLARSGIGDITEPDPDPASPTEPLGG